MYVRINLLQTSNFRVIQFENVLLSVRAEGFVQLKFTGKNVVICHFTDLKIVFFILGLFIITTVSICYMYMSLHCMNVK